ncbi:MULTISPECIES: hypothetical protein [Paenibacillus]|uniref:hypothetical protein n=1 Tax=Paenibacillus TaxID=44249 RepID=UPI0015C34B8A|nr:MULTISPECIES: hypothetical protein [Paenibacillus]
MFSKKILVPIHTISDGHDTSFNLALYKQFVPNTMKLAVNARLKRFDIFIIVGVDSDFNHFIYFSQKKLNCPICPSTSLRL